MKIQIEKGPVVNLTKSNFLSSGGEGEIYVKNNEAYKIYTDTHKMLPVGKIKELSIITNKNVITPKKIILNTVSHKPIGYTMDFVKNTHSLVKIFTKAFREREGLSHEVMRDLILNFQDLVKSIHKHKILIVDLNEWNFLVNKSFNNIYAIDTDSYQTPSYPATAIMESIRDRHSKTFNENTDWFAFAILSFQMFIGIHPYKGKHKVKDINDRMIKNISVLNKDVTIPHVCYPLTVIPKTYIDWYKAVLENGKRLPPPDSFEPSVIELSTRIISGTDNFNILELMEYDGDILDVQYYGNNRVITSKYFYFTNNRKFTVNNKYKAGWFETTKDPVLGKLNNNNNNKLELLDIENKKEIPNQISGLELMSYNGSFYVKSEEHILYVEIIQMKTTTIVAPKVVANILSNSTKMYDGVVIQNVVGAMYVSFFPEPTRHQQIHIKELDGYRIYDAKYDSYVFMAEVFKNGKYKRATVRFDKKWTYEIFFSDEDISPKPVNFVVLDKGNYGVVVSIVDDGEVVVFLNTKDNKVQKKISDPVVGNDMKLFKSGVKAVFAKENKLFSLEMKK